MHIELQVTASGTPREVINALKRIIQNLEGSNSAELEVFTYEDAHVYALAKTFEDA